MISKGNFGEAGTHPRSDAAALRPARAVLARRHACRAAPRRPITIPSSRRLTGVPMRAIGLARFAARVSSSLSFPM